MKIALLLISLLVAAAYTSSARLQAGESIIDDLLPLTEEETKALYPSKAIGKLSDMGDDHVLWDIAFMYNGDWGELRMDARTAGTPKPSEEPPPAPSFWQTFVPLVIPSIGVGVGGGREGGSRNPCSPGRRTDSMGGVILPIPIPGSSGAQAPATAPTKLPLDEDLILDWEGLQGPHLKILDSVFSAADAKTAGTPTPSQPPPFDDLKTMLSY